MISSRTKKNLRNEFRANPLTKVGFALIGVIVLAAIFAPVLAPHNPTTQDSSTINYPPLGFSQEGEETTRMVDGQITTVTESKAATIEHPLGTDANGRDVLSRALYGARTSLLVGITTMLLSATLGTATGMVAGYYGGRTDSVLMRVVDVVLAFPSLLVALALAGIVGSVTIGIPDPLVVGGLVTNRPETIVYPVTIVVAIASTGWVWIGRVARGEAVAVRNEEYVMAARAIGMSNADIIRKHVLPNCITPIVVLATIQIAAIIIIESSLSFLGFSGTTLSWGYDIAQGRDYLASAWWIASVPGLFIVTAVVGINLLGDWLRDALDPGIQEGTH